MRGYPIVARVSYKDSIVDISFNLRVKMFVARRTGDIMYCMWADRSLAINCAYILNRYTALRWNNYAYRFHTISTRAFSENLKSMVRCLKIYDGDKHIDKVGRAQFSIKTFDVDLKVLQDLHKKYLKNKMIKEV